ncbi:MAG: PEP-CTERM sorting domain-containing protein [Akkermansiaceae bacterium]|nr:PEP-CTERM sorting domain-containing protein [Akkermansiaceae bacterium]MDG2324987.1 PEP-CTERM sorting domain-containing protein [Akkermansiaceae bacterium]
MKSKTPSLLPLAALALAAIPAQAALISIAPGNVTASTEIPGFNRIDDHLVDGSGLTAGQHTTVVEPNMWLSAGNGFGGIDADPFVIFDLGAVYTINSFHVWNYNEAPPLLVNRGVNGVTVEYGETTGLGSTVPGISSFAIADGLATYAGEEFSSFTPFDARYIKFDINTNHGDGNTFYGLSEVQFDGELTVVPEPTTGALAGLSLLALAFRRRR